MDPQIRFKEKSVIIHRDENGFGLRVGGENPVFVDCVHENGAAWKAGVRKHDRIIKVNGTLVRSYDHQKVVHMIQNCTPFVNLTLHSPESVVTELFTVIPSGSQAIETNCSGLQSGSSSANNNIAATSMKIHPKNQRPSHSHSISTNLNWLLDIGDDLFQDNQQQLQASSDAIAVTPSAHQSTGVSKLIVSGPSPLLTITTQSPTSGGKPKLRHTRNQASTRDNPYYYYKTASEKAAEAISSSNRANSSLSIKEQQATSKSGPSQPIVRSRSSSKMSTRSMSGKYKARNLRSRLVEDLRSLTIANSQTTPSSLSSSPSSSDLSDCDEHGSSRLDCISMNTSNSSVGGANTSTTGFANTSISASDSRGAATKLRHTTRRLEIIRELVDTEKTHTERLKHLNDLLYKPIKAEGLVPIEQLRMVFSCHKTLFKIHRQIYKILSAAQQNVSECHKEPLVGKALVEIFHGELGIRLEKAASIFCACQSTNTELLNRFTRKDTKAGEFLAQVATQQMLGRLGIKDLLASCFQRLTKYPLLLENLLKATPTGTSSGIHSKSLSEDSIAASLSTALVNPTATDGPSSDNPELVEQQIAATTDQQVAPPTDNHDEFAVDSTIEDDYAYERLCISRALHKSRQILIRVNEAVKRAISHNKLREIWKKTDKHPTLPVIDIETQQLVHEGPLTLRLARRSFEVYVLLLTHYLVILTREGQDKYKLKYFTGTDGKLANQFSPIFNIDEHLATRDTATDENGFYLLCKCKEDSRIYEFASQSPMERAKWKEKIHMAQLHNFAAVPDDDNTLTRYRELITLATSSNTPNNIEHSPTNNNIVANSTQSNISLSDNYNLASTSEQQINSNLGHDVNIRAQDV